MGDFAELDLKADLMEDIDDVEMNLRQVEAITGDDQRRRNQPGILICGELVLRVYRVLRYR